MRAQKRQFWPEVSTVLTGSITPFGVGQKVNIIVILVEIMVTFCKLHNVIRV
jgi:hypothetical protein